MTRAALASSSRATTITVGIAEYAVGRRGATLATMGLGSCVAIALHARDAGVGALAHVLLPNVLLSTSQDAPGKFASTVLPVMLRRMRELGAGEEVQARLVGGASMFPGLLATGAVSLGARNVAAARAACAGCDVEVVGEDVGGTYGRSVYLDVAEGSLLGRSMHAGDVHL